MYEGLYTNLPKEVMGYHDFQFPQSIEESYVSSDNVLKFLQSYADHFQLHAHIKLQHSVIRVRPRKHQWEVIVRDIANDRYFTKYFDFIFVCNGHYTKPSFPKIPGMDIYEGRQLHSHVYRKSEQFKDETLLVIGAGPSGLDIASQLNKTAKHIFLSHHLDPAPNVDFMTNVTVKTDVQTFTDNGAVFKDGTTEHFTTVIYCTGYHYTFPFLSMDAGLYAEENGVYPLYKHCININYPTMAIIGLVFRTLPTQCFDLQIRFAMKYFSNQLQLPSREDMLADLEEEKAKRLASGLPKRFFHCMGPRQYDYYKDLANLAGVEPIRMSLQEIMKHCGYRYLYELGTFRSTRFRVIDDERFEAIP